MNVTEIAIVIKEVGFPIFVACYVLIRMERTIRTLAESLNNMSKTLSSMERKE